MMVVIYHFWPSGELTTNWLKLSIGRSYLWVDLFFCAQWIRDYS